MFCTHVAYETIVSGLKLPREKRLLQQEINWLLCQRGIHFLHYTLVLEEERGLVVPKFCDILRWLRRPAVVGLRTRSHAVVFTGAVFMDGPLELKLSDDDIQEISILWT
jgi:hypothetical protein